MDMQGYTWICRGIHGYAEAYMDMQGYTWICKGRGLGNVFTNLLITLSIINGHSGLAA